MGPGDPLTTSESTSIVKDTSSAQPAKTGSKPVESHSTTADDGINPIIAAELKLRDEQDDALQTQIISYLDWDGENPDPEPDFKPFHFFVSSELQKKHPELKPLVEKLKAVDATRKIAHGPVENGVAWYFSEPNQASALQSGVDAQRPRMCLSFDLVKINGVPQVCRVAVPISAP